MSEGLRQLPTKNLAGPVRRPGRPAPRAHVRTQDRRVLLAHRRTPPDRARHLDPTHIPAPVGRGRTQGADRERVGVRRHRPPRLQVQKAHQAHHRRQLPQAVATDRCGVPARTDGDHRGDPGRHLGLEGPSAVPGGHPEREGLRTPRLGIRVRSPSRAHRLDTLHPSRGRHPGARQGAPDVDRSRSRRLPCRGTCQVATGAAVSVTCALRIGEVLALPSRDLDLESGTLTVRATVAKVSTAEGGRQRILQTPKTAAAVRTVHLLPHTIPDLRTWRTRPGSSARRRFCSPTRSVVLETTMCCVGLT